MGLDSEVLAALEADKACAPAFDVRLDGVRNLVVISDAIGFALRKVRRRRPTGGIGAGYEASTFDETTARIMTGNEWAETVWALHRHIIHTTGCKYHVILLDDGERVPSQKHNTQEKRDGATVRAVARGDEEKSGLVWASPEAAAIETAIAEARADGYGGTMRTAYPPGTEVNYLGVLLPGQSHALPMDMDRVCMSRPLRKPLFDFLCAYLKSIEMPPGVTVVLDYAKEGPWFMRRGQPVVQMTSLRHPWGEADLMIPFWCRYFRNTGDVLIDSIDSDVVLVMLNYLASVPPEDKRYRVLQQRGVDDKKKKAAGERDAKSGPIDLQMLLKGVGMGRLQAVTTMAILLGTDFHEKKSCIFRVGSKPLMQWALAQPPSKRPPWEEHDLRPLLAGIDSVWEAPFGLPALLPPSGAAPPATSPLGAHAKLMLFVQSAVAGVSEGKRAAASAKSKTGKAGKAKPAASHFTLEGARSWAWNLQYWLINWPAIRVEHAV